MIIKLTRCTQVFIIILVLFIALRLNASAQTLQQSSSDPAWQQFMEWLPGAPQANGLHELIMLYYFHMISKGASSEEANRQLDVVLRTLHKSSDAWRIMFNNIYNSKNPDFTTQPNELLIDAVKNRKPGHALDIGMGEGRNSVFLAMKGWDVTGFDISEEGLAKARRNAQRAGVKINIIHIADEEFEYGTNQWDLIVLVYMPLPLTSASYVRRLRKAMKPGGIIVIEGYSMDANSPNKIPLAIDPVQLRAAFKDFRILHFEDKTDMPDWGKTLTRIVRMVAEKRR
jgi:SAM-dependent methyltransferase